MTLRNPFNKVVNNGESKLTRPRDYIFTSSQLLMGPS